MHPQNSGLAADDEHDRTNRFEYTGDPPLPSSSHRAASQPPRTSTDQPFLSSPVISNRSPWSTQNRLLTPGGVGIPVPPMNSRSASFSHAHLGGGGSGGGSSASTSSSYFASAMRERSFSSTFEDDESEELADDASAIVGRLAPGGGDPYDDDGDGDTFDLGYEPSSYHGRPGIGTGGGRLPPSLSSSISPSMLSTPANPMTRGRTFAPDLSRSRSQSLATATATRPLAIGASYGGYGTAGLGSAISSWNGDEGYLSSGLGGMGKFGEIRRPTQQDQSNMSPFHRDVGQILLDDPSSHSQLRDLLVRGDREREDVLGGGKYGHIGGQGQGYAGIYGGPAAGVGRAGGGGGGYGGLGGLGGVSSGRGGGGGEYMADGGGSGAGSRRHSLSVIQPGKRGSFVGSFGAGGGGSALEDEFDDGQGHGQRIPIGGAGNIRRPSASYIGSGGASGGGGGGGGSGLMLSDEDLVGAGDLNMNFGMMSLRDQISHPPTGSPGGRGGLAVPGSGVGGGMTSQPSSLPIYAPMSRSPLGGGAGAIGSTLGLSIPGHGIGGHQDAREGTSSRASRGSASEHSQSQGTGSGQGSSPGPVQPGLPPLQVQGQQQPQAPQGQGQVQNQGLNGTYASRARAGSNAGMPSSPLSPMSPTRGMIGFGMGGAMGGLMSPTHVHPQQQQFHGHQQQQQPQQQHPQHGFYAPQQQPQHLIGRRASNASLHGAPTGPDGGAAATQGGNEHGLGRGLPLSAVPPSWQLYIVEFKAGRTDLFYMTDALRLELLRAEQGGQQNGHGGNPVKVGDYVIVEADRGRDLGRVVNDSITIEEVERWLEGRAAAAAANPHSGAPVSAGPESAGGGGAWGDTPMSPTMSSHSGPHGSSHKKEINPKQIYAKAGPNEAALLSVKTADEVKALQLCQSKVRAKKLPMEVVDAEYQWDRRKLTFYFVAEKRIDFRELVRELFRLYKTRIWMASLQGAGGFEQ